MLKAILIFEIGFFSQLVAGKLMTCGELGNKIKSYEKEIDSLKISLEEYELIIGKTEDVLDECNESQTCSSCLWEKRNSRCGWCILRNRCSLNENCPAENSSSNFWITARDRCPKIRAVTPHNVAVATSTMIQVIIPYLPDYEGTFICSFKMFQKTLVTKGQQFERGITCESPHPDSLPRIPVGEDHVDVTFSVRIPNGPNFASTSNFTIYDCSHYKTCSECSASVYPCAWCVQSQKCIHDVYENCKNDVIVFSQSVTRPTFRQGPGYCPRISSNSESENEIILASGSKNRISVKVENLMIFHVPARFTCKVKGFPEVTGTVLGEMLFCDDIKLRLMGRQPVYNLSFSVFWNGEGQLDNPENLHVILYHCERMAKSCGECIDLPDRYNCGWCEESHSCTIRDRCTESIWMDKRNTCKRPEITSIYPSSGLLNIKTNLTIEGVNLAKEFGDIESITLIGEDGQVLTDCKPHEHLHIRHSKIGCSLNPPKIPLENNGTLSGFIELKLVNDLITFSETQYSFVEPVVTDFRPVKGMASGGTVLKITGYHLDAGNVVYVYIGDIPCRILSRDSSSIRCVSSPIPIGDRVPKSSAVRVIFDGEEKRSSSYFFYVADPCIHSVKGEQGSQNAVGTPSGSNLVIVEGTNFDYAPSPYIYVIMDSVEYPGACTVLSEERMDCFTPIIPADALNFCEGEGYMSLHYGFKMGNAQNVQNISLNADFGMYKLYPDPYLISFNEEKKIKTFKSDYLVIQGKYLDTVYDENDFKVTIGGQECPITSVSHTQLTCRVREIHASDYDENSLPEVQVKIRNSFQYFIGFLRFQKD